MESSNRMDLSKRTIMIIGACVGFILLVIVALLIYFFVIKNDSKNLKYCAAELCPGGKKHIGCKHPEEFVSGCNGEIIQVDPYIDEILEAHNKLRNELAGGELNGFPSAARMATTAWDEELAKIAGFNVYQCEMKHDECRNTEKYKFSGQNLAVVFSRDVNMQSFCTDRVKDWHSEYKDATPDDMEKYTGGSGAPIGHFTAMSHERNDRVGCAIAKYTYKGASGTLLACNYAVTNMMNNPIYKAGDAASECKSGNNIKYPNLCSSSEEYDYNDWSSSF